MKIKIVLRDCPFCGGKAEIIRAEAQEKLYGIHCTECHVLMGHVVGNATEFFRTPLEAADTWNKRA